MSRQHRRPKFEGDIRVVELASYTSPKIIEDPRNSFIKICEFLNVKKPFNIENIFIKNQFKNPNSKSFHDLFNEMPVLRKEFEKKYSYLLKKFQYK